MLVFSLFVLVMRRPYFPRWLAVPGFLNAGFFFLFLTMPTTLDEASDLEATTLALLNNRPDVLPLAIFEWAIIFGVMAWALLIGATLMRFNQVEMANAD